MGWCLCVPRKVREMKQPDGVYFCGASNDLDTEATLSLPSKTDSMMPSTSLLGELLKNTSAQTN